MLASPALFVAVIILLAVVFIALFLMIVNCIPAVTMLTLAAGCCKVGEEAQQALAASLVAISEWRPDAEVFQANLTRRIENLCATDVDLLSGQAGKFCIGLALMVLGQLWQISSHVSHMTEVFMQEDLEEEDDKAKVRDYYKRQHPGFNKD
eukprot:TRINITY_DN11707_c0_g1_i2.p1 TRINITY_DN11707_c0_g1~~TRINITY_DN11707_c0_g1_i2.p1  ORF type:complete len:151 (+),score=35.23 TRINITY_DN11707_c0_g1_i2:575-1027(+)